MSRLIFSKAQSVEIFDLGLHPFADTFISKRYLNIKEPVYPLKCRINLSTGCIFNHVITQDEKRYNLYDYSYTSSNSNYSKNYWRKYALDFSKKYKNKGKIFEIGCNDGFLLENLKQFGYKVSGCDASNFISKISKNKKLNIFNKIFNFESSKQIKKKFKKFDYIIANNVVNHSNNPNDFIKGVKNILDVDGFFIFEQPYWVSMMKSKKIDQIYHEHITYFTLKFSNWILRQNGMYIHDFKVTEYHGGSLRVIAKKINNTLKKNRNKISKAINKESRIGIFKKNYYKKINNFLSIKKRKFLNAIINYKNQNYCIVGIGAAAKANTFLNYVGLDNKIVDFMTDASKYKIGKFTPKTRIPIYSDNKISKISRNIVAIILSWNISDMLENKLKKLNKRLKFIYF